jgi:endonuclease G
MLLVPTATVAAPSACPWHVADGQAPDPVDPRLSAKTRELCFVGFAVLHSGVTRTPLWAAEHLTRGRVNAAEAMERTSTFHAEPRVPPDERAELADYARSGFDRGHLAPSGDMPDERSQQESFTLANIVPQNPDNNRNLWGPIESVVRPFAQTEGELYVVTGPIFQGARLKRLHGRVLVPTHVFKGICCIERRPVSG